MIPTAGLHNRAAFFQAIRAYFTGKHFLEVDTPVRQPLVIPEQNIVHIPSGKAFLQSSPELYMKRLLAGSTASDIFQICRCFRQGERGRLHLEEFVMLEWYRRDADYKDLMADCEELLRFLFLQLKGHSFPVSVADSWQYLTVADAFVKYCSSTVEEALEQDRFDIALVEEVEPHLGQNKPTFLYDYPCKLASLARCKKEDPEIAERFELYVEGVELANGFSELTDPTIQRKRFADEYGEMGSAEHPMPERFLAALDQLQEVAGIAMGLDRLFMLFMGEKEISEVVTFHPEEYDQ